MIELIALLLTDFLRSFAEVDGGSAGLLWKIAQQGPGEENHKVQDGDNWQQVDGEGTGDHSEDKVGSVDESQLLHPDRDDEKQQNLLIREQSRIGEKHGQIKILSIDTDPQTTDKVHQKTVDDSQKPADQQIDIKLWCPPVLLQRTAHPVVEIKDQKCKKTGAGRVEHKSKQAPDLPAKNQRGVKAEVAHQHTVRGTKNPENDVGDRQIPHEVRDTEVGMPITETINQTHGIFHTNTPSKCIFLLYYIIF